MGKTMGKESTMIVRGLALALSLGGCGSDDGHPASQPDAAAGGGGAGASGGSGGTGASGGSGGTGASSGSGGTGASSGSGGTGASSGSGGTGALGAGGAAGSGGSGECIPGDKQCNALVPQTCSVNGAWLDGAPCPYICLTGTCAGACTPDSKQCSGNTPQTCDAGGQWQSGAICPNVCSSGECAGACVPGAKQCNGLVVQSCDANGAWQDDSTCPYVCSNGACTGVCSPGAQQCAQQVPQTCDAGGSWQNGSACPYVCSTGSCGGECTPGATQCADNGVQTCSASGQWGTAAACTNQACVNGACTAAPPSCQGLTTSCGPSTSESCCTSPLVSGGTFFRSYDGVTSTNQSYPATVSDFRLDKYEVTVGRFRKFVEAGQGTQKSPPASGSGANPNLAGSGWQSAWNSSLAADTTALISAVKCFSPHRTWTDSEGGNEKRPMICISWYEAFAFCIWDGGRLPTEAEWNYAAAGGSEQRMYPWLIPATSTSIDCTRASYGCSTNACGDGTKGCAVTDLIFVGTKAAGNGKYGQADLAGNVWEWTLDWNWSYPNPCNDCANLTAYWNGTRVVRGGSFNTNASYLLSSTRYSVPPDSHGETSGARCARSP
jgi:formylglycine-generating enzyme